MRVLFLFFLLVPVVVYSAQIPDRQQQTDSLIIVLQTKSDSAKIPILLSLSWDLRNTAPDRSAAFGMQAIELAERFKDYESLAKAYSFAGVAYRVMGKYSESIDFYMKGHDIAEKHNLSNQVGFAHLNLANLYIYQEHYSLAIDYIRQAETTAKEIGDKSMLAYVYLYYGRAQRLQNELGTALESYKQSLAIREELNQPAEQATCLKYIGDIYFDMGQIKLALENYDKSLERTDKQNDKDLYANILVRKSTILLMENKRQEASELAHQGLATASQIGANLSIRDALQILASIALAENDYMSAYNYQQRVIQYNDALFNQDLSEKIFSLEFQKAEEQRKIKIDLLNSENAIKELEIKRIRIISLALTAVILLLTTTFVILLLSMKNRKERARLLEVQNQEIIKQRNNIEEQNKRLIETNEKLELSEDNLRKMVQTKDRLFSIIAHDLRNPFTALGGLTELLHTNASKLKPDEVAEYASMINDSSRKLLVLIENLLQWANSQTGRLKYIPKVLSMRNVGEEVVRILKNQADVKEINLKTEIPENLTVYADYDSLATILRNLISNGIKYTNRKGSVTLSAFQQSNHTVIKVSDTGIGISQQIINKLFKIEESFTTEGTDQEPGSGLGLIISKEFIDRNKGTITVESQLTRGTTFTVTLPATGKTRE